MKETRLADLITGILLMLLSAFWFFQANKMMKVELGIGPGDYPKFAAAGLFFLGLILAAQSVSKGLPGREGKIDRRAARRLIIFVVVSFVYVRLMRFLGFILLTPPYLFFGSWFFGYRKYIIAAIVSIGVTAGIYIVFRMIFQVMLPEFRLF